MACGFGAVTTKSSMLISTCIGVSLVAEKRQGSADDYL